jgi:hypothetical protein
LERAVETAAEDDGPDRFFLAEQEKGSWLVSPSTPFDVTAVEDHGERVGGRVRPVFLVICWPSPVEDRLGGAALGPVQILAGS